MSSSCNATAPIDISTNANTNPIKVGSFICSYDPDMCAGASVSMSEDLVYLSIKCNSSNDSKVVFYGGGSYIPTEIRIYAPSLHTYNGSHTDAEMLIVHSPGSNASSSGLIVSVPISITSNGQSADMSAIFQAANTINPGTISVNSSAPINEDINVNDLIPAKPYYVYYGTLPYDSCGGNYYYAVFTDTISAVGPISNLVASGIATVPMASKTNLQKSNGPPTTGSGDDGQAEEYVLYQVVDNDECSAADSKPKNKGKTNADDSETRSLGINAIFGIALALMIIGVAYLFWNWNVVKTATATAVAAAASAVSSAPIPRSSV